MERKKFGKGYLWSQDEIEFIKLYKDADLTKKEMPQEIVDRLYPRSKDSIYCAWKRYAKGTLKSGSSKQKKNDTHRVQVSRNFSVFLQMFANCFDKYLQEAINEGLKLSDIEKKNSDLAKENAELKDLLRKLTKVREAVESFKL